MNNALSAKILDALQANLDPYAAAFTFPHVRDSLSSGTGAFIVRDLLDIKVRKTKLGRTVTALAVVSPAPNYDTNVILSYKLRYNGKVYKAKLGS